MAFSVADTAARRLRDAVAGMVAALAIGAPALAEEVGRPLIVVELFTSQGCSSCPPADDLFAQLAQKDDLLPLALHVDYWDYIGWKDQFAQPQFTDRQKAYARAAGSRTIYTPQMVVGGLHRVAGTAPMELAEVIGAHRDQPVTVMIRLTRQGDRVAVDAPAAALPAPVVVQLVRWTPSQTVEIRQGENAGHTITYHNIVTEWRAIGEWNGQAPLSMTAEAPGDAPTAVILQEEGPGPVIAAAALR